MTKVQGESDVSDAMSRNTDWVLRETMEGIDKRIIQMERETGSPIQAMLAKLDELDGKVSRNEQKLRAIPSSSRGVSLTPERRPTPSQSRKRPFSDASSFDDNIPVVKQEVEWFPECDENEKPSNCWPDSNQESEMVVNMKEEMDCPDRQLLPRVCTVQGCHRRFVRHIELIVHCVQEHPQLIVYTCENCNSDFSDEMQFDQHNKIPHSHQCPTCPMSFARRYDLLSHIRVSHVVERRFKCTKCAQTFFRRAHAERHLKTAHKTRAEVRFMVQDLQGEL